MKFHPYEIWINLAHESCPTPRALVYQMSKAKFAGRESLQTFADWSVRWISVSATL